MVAAHMSALGGKVVALHVLAFDPTRTCHVLFLEDRANHLSCSIARCRELIAITISQIDGDPIVSDRLVDPALEITVAHFKKIISLQRASRGNPMTHKNAEDLTANLHIGRSVRHGSTIGFARHRSYGRTATVDKIAQPMNLPLGCRPPLRAMGRCVWQKQRPLQRTAERLGTGRLGRSWA